MNTNAATGPNTSRTLFTTSISKPALAPKPSKLPWIKKFKSVVGLNSDVDSCSFDQPSDEKFIRNIIIFGETGLNCSFQKKLLLPTKSLKHLLGTGKSSTINLLAGSKVAKVSGNAGGCTRFPTEYVINGPTPTEMYTLFDTGGFSEGARGIVTYKNAKMALQNLVIQTSSPF
jgi:hypothetical protein